MTDRHVEAELIAYLDGELSAEDHARVMAHLATCPQCATALAELRVLQQEVGATLDAALSPVRLSRDADNRIREVLQARVARPRWQWRLWQRRGLLAQALLAVMVLLMSVSTLPMMTAPPSAPQETLILGQDRFAPGSDAALRVIVRSAETALPMAGAQIAVTLSQAPGLARRVYEGVTDASGSADVTFAVPENLSGDAELVVETQSVAGEGRIVRPITVARAYKLYLGSDKPAYRPGQTLHLRVLALDAHTLKPVTDDEVAFSVMDPQGQVVALHQSDLSDYGVAATDVILPTTSETGLYHLVATLGDTSSERTVTVAEYELPAFRVTFDTDRTFYAPGARVVVTGEANYFFAKPVDRAMVVLRGYLAPETSVVTLDTDTDADGHFRFVFDLPPAVGGDVDFDLEVEVVDRAGQRAGLRRSVPVAVQPLVIKAVPESRVLKPGVENLVYIHTAYPDGAPAATQLTIEVDGAPTVLDTDAHGLAVFPFTPSRAAPTPRLKVYAEDGVGRANQQTFDFEAAPEMQVLLLRAERAAYEVGETLRLEALIPGNAETVYLDVVRAGQMVAALSSPTVQGRAIFVLDLDAALVGALELRAYALLDDGSLAQDTRLVVVDAPRRVDVTVSADQAQYRPGETAQLQIETALSGQEAPTPIASALGIAVIDESVTALETLPPSFARAYFLLGREGLAPESAVTTFDAPALLDADAEVRMAQDLAARAAWAGAPVADVGLQAKAVTEVLPVVRTGPVNRLGVVLALLPLLICVAVVRALAPAGLLGRALRRVGWGLLGMVVISPLLIVGGVIGVLLPRLGSGAALLFFIAVGVLLVVLLVHGWQRRDARLQIVSGGVLAYVILLGLAMFVTRGVTPAAWVLPMVVATFLLLVVALAVLGQGLVLEERRTVGWCVTALALLLMLLAITLPAVPKLSSSLTYALGDPGLYVGPLGWLTGCGAAPEAPMATEEPAIEESEEVEAEEPLAEATASVSTPSPAPTATPAGTTLPVPAEPYPLRQIFPETLYWAPEARTDAGGALMLDLPLADTITTWRLTALASTREGDLGAASYDLRVYQDFFIDLVAPASVVVARPVTITVMLYNYLPEAQSVRLRLVPDDWYTPLEGPDLLSLESGDITSATYVIRPEATGNFLLQVEADGTLASDALLVDINVVAEDGD